MHLELIKSEIKLTIGMLVSNNIKYIRKAMEALQPLLKAVPSELIVVDTKGSKTDGSIEIVREYTDKIYPFTWCNDFSAARNICLEHAVGEWFLYQDDDEWFDDVTELIEFFQSGECECYNSGFYNTRDYVKDGTYTMGIAGRMIRRCTDTCFVGRVHEGFNRVMPPYRHFQCFTHHMGYIFEDAGAEKQHQERNVSILHIELKEHGYTPRLCAQMVQELLHRKETAKAGYEFAMKCIPALQKQKQLNDACSQWVLVGTVRYFAQQDEYERMLKQAKYIRGNYQLSHIARLVLAAVVLRMAGEKGDTKTLQDNVSLYLEQYDWKKQHEEEALVQTQLDFPQYFTKEYYVSVVRAGIIAAIRLEQLDLADKYKQRIFIKSDIKLTIGILVSNHIQYIRKTMESLQPLLEAVPSELIVLDTKGAETDGSIDVVREYTDRIYPFTWCNDFSAARNACLDYARGEWFLYIDDDEWFDDVTEFIEFFQNNECEEYNAGFYYTRDYLPEGGYSMDIAGRMIRRAMNTRFEGKIHETFQEIFGPNKVFSCFTHHYGYMYANEEEKKKKKERNLSILKQEIEEQGVTPRWAAQLVIELLGDEESREEGYQKAVEFAGHLEKAGQLMDSCSQWVLVSMVRYFCNRGMHEQLVEQAEEVQHRYPLTPTAELVLARIVFLSAVEEGDLNLALQQAELYFKSYDWRQKNEKEALTQVQLDFPKFLSDACYYDTIHKAAKAANALRNYQKANEFWKRMPWKKEGFDASRYEEDMNHTIRGLRKEKEVQQEEKIKQIYSLMEILSEAGGQMKRFFAEGNISLAKQYLAAMQEAAVSLEAGMRNVLSKGSVAVMLLEQYLGLLRNGMAVERSKDGVDLADVICEATGLISETFRKETWRQKTLLLFPKRGTEWHLFEPYWKEAKQKGEKVYVIPVPCYEKGEDGSLGDRLYSEEDYPEEVELTDYRKYDYGGKLADVMVVGDDYNAEQKEYAVHPFFYINNLEQYTKKLKVVSGIGN